jgi:hypothetical protein
MQSYSEGARSRHALADRPRRLPASLSKKVAGNESRTTGVAGGPEGSCGVRNRRHVAVSKWARVPSLPDRARPCDQLALTPAPEVLSRGRPNLSSPLMPADRPRLHAARDSRADNQGPRE